MWRGLVQHWGNATPRGAARRASIAPTGDATFTLPPLDLRDSDGDGGGVGSEG
jgi:hypothetical protein